MVQQCPVEGCDRLAGHSGRHASPKTTARKSRGGGASKSRKPRDSTAAVAEITSRGVGHIELVDGEVRMTVNISVDVRELRKWEPQRLDRFFNGLAGALAAANG